MIDLRRIYTVGSCLELEFLKWDDRLHYVWPATVREVFADRLFVESPTGTIFRHMTRQKELTLDWHFGWSAGIRVAQISDQAQAR